MKNVVIRVWLLMGLLVGVLSCQTYDIEEVLLVNDDVALIVRGTPVFTYDAGTCQLGFNDQKNEFRVYDDSIGEWFILTCDKLPDTEGMSLKAKLEYTVPTSLVSYKDLTFVVKKTSGEYSWLWNDSRSIGVVLRLL